MYIYTLIHIICVWGGIISRLAVEYLNRGMRVKFPHFPILPHLVQ